MTHRTTRTMSALCGVGVILCALGCTSSPGPVDASDDAMGLEDVTSDMRASDVVRDATQVDASEPPADAGHPHEDSSTPEDTGPSDAAPEDKCELFGTTCPAPSACQTGGECDPATGECRPFVTVADGMRCDDGNLCTQTDTCRAGACVGSSPITCPTPSNPCRVAGVCDPMSGRCGDATALPEGTACSRGMCNASGTCSVCRAGVCTDDENLDCLGGTCNCGALGQPVCGAPARRGCATGLAWRSGVADARCICIPGVSCGCGGMGEACCDASTGYSACTFNLTCTGGRCACGGEGQACCGSRTGSGTMCTAGSCIGRYDSVDFRFSGTCRTTCGGAGQPCCPGNGCGLGLACAGGTCGAACGAAGQPCCSAGDCQSNLACVSGTCDSNCGAPGQPCCFPVMCRPGAVCTAGLRCIAGG